MSLQGLYEKSWERKIDHALDAPEPGSRTDLALSLLPGGEHLLDVGCGDGAFMRWARHVYKEVSGVDISAHAAAAARRHELSVSECDLNNEPLPFGAEVFDTVVALDVIEHVIEPDRFLSEIARVLRPGGWLLLSTPNIRYLKRVLRLIFSGRFPQTSDDPVGFDGGHLHYFTSRDVWDLVRQAGLEPVKTIGILPSKKMASLRRLSHLSPVYEWLSPGMLVLARRPIG